MPGTGVDELLRFAADAPSPRRRLDYLDAADVLLESPDPRSVVSVLLRARALRALGRLAEAEVLLDSLPARIHRLELPVDDRMELLAASRLEHGMLAFLKGDLAFAGENLLDGLQGNPITGLPDGHADAEAALSFSAYLLGRLPPAREHLSRAESGHLAALAATLLDLETGDPDDAVERAAEVGQQASGTEWEAIAWCVEAYALHARGDHDAALASLWRLGDQGSTAHPPLTGFLAMVGQLEVLTARHEYATALGLLRTVEPDDQHAVCPDSWEARLLLETADFARAAELTEPCLQPGRPHAARTLAFALTVHAAALAGMRDFVSADSVFERALSLASVTGLRRHLVGLPPKLLSLLMARAASAELPPSSQAVLIDIVTMLPTPPLPPEPVLSARERVVLEHLAAGEPLQRVAWLLSVSPNTVKLGVASRDSAVQRGRSLGLLG
jgi:tetratricopeptide (TPR) repeat protein/DNA-binding CsgD family transcriptional regulator